ncbi:MAG TPA: extracellular solute-binding protein, partial [Acidimicrobiia bacterium]|nr:extracellular solute-binding protein [Acidimicrobiia bacterium]
MSGPDLARRDFLRLTAGGATALLAIGAGCNSGSDTEKSKAATDTTAGVQGKRQLRIAQWTHYISGYDQWWDDVYTKSWGERNDVEVTVDHFDINQASAHAETEVASQQGHDLFHFNLNSPVAFEDHVIDHREIVEEVEARVGELTPFIRRSVYNPKTKKYFGFSHFWTPNPIQYRRDLWGALSSRPDTWEDVLVTGRRLKAQGHPIGIGMGADHESNVTLLGLMHGFGAAVQDGDAKVVINSPATVEAVKFGAELFRSAMSEEVLGWDITSNNRHLISGRGSMIVNSIAAIRALEDQDPPLAAKVELLPFPKGPAGTASPYVVSIYAIWKFARNQELAKQFLVDLAPAYGDPLLQSQFLQMPSYPEAVPDLAERLANDEKAQPPDKYRFMFDAAEWSTNVGHPGHTNAAIDEVVRAAIVSRMFADAARGEMSAEEAVK